MRGLANTFYSILLGALLASDLALAVDIKDILASYSLVGVIANSSDAKSQSGVAVVKNQVSGKTLTLTVGNYIPFSNIKVKAINKDELVISNGSEDELLGRFTIADLNKPSAPIPEFPEPTRVSEDVQPVFEREIYVTKSGEVVDWQEFTSDRNDEEDFDRKVIISVPGKGYIRGVPDQNTREPSSAEGDSMPYPALGDSGEGDFRQDRIEDSTSNDSNSFDAAAPDNDLESSPSDDEYNEEFDQYSSYDPH